MIDSLIISREIREEFLFLERKPRIEFFFPLSLESHSLPVRNFVFTTLYRYLRPRKEHENDICGNNRPVGR